jgi:hypothetical protein
MRRNQKNLAAAGGRAGSQRWQGLMQGMRMSEACRWAHRKPSRLLPAAPPATCALPPPHLRLQQSRPSSTLCTSLQPGTNQNETGAIRHKVASQTDTLGLN